TRAVKIITQPPSVKVYLNGVYVDITPTFLKLDVGKTYNIKLTKEGYEEKEVNIYIPEKGQVIEKEYTLRPKKTTLKIYTNPEGASVYLNGKYQGISPLTIEKSEQPIKGTIKITKKGYEEESIDVYVKARKEKIINETLKKIILLDIKTVPSGAKVYLDDNYIGETPLYEKVAVKEGLKKGLLVIKKAKYEIVKEQIPLWKDRVSLSFSLKKTAPSIIWQKALGGSSKDWAYSIQQTSDGGYIVAGWTRSYYNGDVSEYHGYIDAWVVKLGESGNIEWQKALGGSEGDEAHSIQQTRDGGYIVAGCTRSNDGDVSGNHGKVDAWVVKLGESGNIEWQKALGGSFWDKAYSIQQTSDGGFIVAGRTASNDGDVSGNHGEVDAWIVKLGW
ncbi:MAG: PEGA domain-containing protein, partial [Thermotogaceae bacterium]|nr:PEGA domain-containing protein [Thermotogaceae bacterium]